MKNTFKLLILFFLIFLGQNISAQTQNYVGHVTLLKRTSSMVYLGAGTTTPNSESKDLGFGNPISVNLGLYQSLWQKNNLGFGLHFFGNYGFGNGAPKSFTELPISGYTSTISNSATPKMSGFSAGAGPQINFGLGENFLLSPLVDFAYVSNKLESYNVAQNYQTSGATGNVVLYSQPEIKTSGLGIIPRLRMQYFFGKNIGIWLEGNYNILPKISTSTLTFVPNGTINQGGTYNIDQIKTGTTSTKEVSINNSGVGFGGGIVINLGKQCLTCGTDKPKPPVAVPTGNPTTKPKMVADNDDVNGDVFTSTLIRKENTDRQNCIKILSPSNGSNQNINESTKISLSNEGLKNTNADVKIYKISNDKNFWNKKENQKQLFDTQNTVFLSGKFEKESQETGFKPISVNTKQSGAVLESTLEKGKLTEGAYKMVVVSNCGVTSSNFSISNSNCNHSAIIKSIDCIGNVDAQGKSKYRVCVDYKNTAAIGCTNCLILLNNPANHSGNVLQGIGGTSISNISSIPSSLSAGNTATICFDATVTSGSNLQFFVLGTCSDGLQTSPNPNYENSYFDEKVKPCICDFCDKVLEFDNNTTPNATYSATNNSLSIHQDWWNMNTAAVTVVGAKAEIVSFEREVSDDCFKCDKDSNQWGNFISGKLGAVNGSFGNAVGSVSGNTHHTLYFANPNSYSFDLNISIPPLSTLSCCCEKIRFKVRYTYIFKDKNGECKMCSAVFEYYYQRGKCPKVINTGTGVSQTATNIDIKNLKN